MSESCKLVRSQNPDSLLIRCSVHGWVGDSTEWDGIAPCPNALGVDDPTAVEGGSAPTATSRTIGMTRHGEPSDEPFTAQLSGPIHVVIQPSDDSGSATGRSEPADDPEPSKPSGPPSTPSTRLWREPRTAMEFAGQANKVATMILNREIDVDTGRLYSSIARTVAQALSTEVSRARYLQNEPNLTFPEDVDEVPAED